MIIRYATREDVASWFSGRVPETMRALVIEDAGEVLAIAGVTQSGAGQQAFSELAPRVREHRVMLGRLAIAFGRMLDAVGGSVFALCDAAEPTSPGLLAHLGFRDHGDSIWRRG
jgi:hypothetical protein